MPILVTSSLASVITVTQLLCAVQLIYAVNVKTIPLLIVASIWYLIVTSVLTVGQYCIERHYTRGPHLSFLPHRGSGSGAAYSRFTRHCR